MVTQVSATEFREGAGELLQQVQNSNDSVVVQQNGKPVAALVAAELFERIRRVQERFDSVSLRISEAYAGIPEADGMAEIESLISRSRAR